MWRCWSSLSVTLVQIQCPRTRPSPTLRRCGLSVLRPHPRGQSARLGLLWLDAQAKEPGEMARTEMQPLTGGTMFFTSSWNRTFWARAKAKHREKKKKTKRKNTIDRLWHISSYSQHEEPSSGWSTLWKFRAWLPQWRDGVFSFLWSIPIQLIRHTLYLSGLSTDYDFTDVFLSMSVIHSVAARTEVVSQARPPGRRPSRPQMWPIWHFLTWA